MNDSFLLFIGILILFGFGTYTFILGGNAKKRSKEIDFSVDMNRKKKLENAFMFRNYMVSIVSFICALILTIKPIYDLIK